MHKGKLEKVNPPRITTEPIYFVLVLIFYFADVEKLDFLYNFVAIKLFYIKEIIK